MVTILKHGYTFFACFGLKNVTKMGKEISVWKNIKGYVFFLFSPAHFACL